MSVAYMNDTLALVTEQAMDVLTLRAEKEFPGEVDKYVIAVVKDMRTDKIGTLFLKSDIRNNKPAWVNPSDGTKLSELIDVLFWNEILLEHRKEAEKCLEEIENGMPSGEISSKSSPSTTQPS